MKTLSYKIIKVILVVISVLSITCAFMVIKYCEDYFKLGFLSNNYISFNISNFVSLIKALTVIGFIISVISTIFSLIVEHGRSASLIDSVLGIVCMSSLTSCSPEKVFEDMVETGKAGIMILLIIIYALRLIINIEGLLLKPKKTSVTSPQADSSVQPAPVQIAPNANVPSVAEEQKTTQAEQIDSGWVCSNCGASNTADARFCPSCGKQK